MESGLVIFASMTYELVHIEYSQLLFYYFR